MSDIKKPVTDLAAAFKKEITLDAKTGIATITPDTYEKLLPATITKESIEALQEYNSNVVAAATLALGELSIPAMKKHKDLDDVKLEIPMIGKDTLNVSFARARQVPNPQRGDGDPATLTKFGSASVSFDMYSTGPRGELKKVKALLTEQAKAAFGN
jgi:hypothetical protein